MKVVSKTSKEGVGQLSWLVHFVAADNPMSSERTRELLEWQPTQPGLIADLDRLRYFET